MGWINWDSIPEERIVDGVRRKLFSSENMTIALWFWDKGVDLPAHSHPEEQLYYLVSGRAVFESEGEHREFSIPGSSWMVPGGVAHGTRYLEDSITMDIFCPRREDMIAGVDPYVRQATKRAAP
ncbi:MAG: cupin domain-containing protein [Myxococcales bacterium]|nr:cupin domain-containing protein [Myxococcales bacterium]